MSQVDASLDSDLVQLVNTYLTSEGKQGLSPMNAVSVQQLRETQRLVDLLTKKNEESKDKSGIDWRITPRGESSE